MSKETILLRKKNEKMKKIQDEQKEKQNEKPSRK